MCMMSKGKRETPEIIVRDGKLVAVIFGIERYLELQELAEDVESLRMLKRMRARPLRFRRLEDFLSDHHFAGLKTPPGP